MNDIAFPEWVASSPAMASAVSLARVLTAPIRGARAGANGFIINGSAAGGGGAAVISDNNNNNDVIAEEMGPDGARMAREVDRALAASGGQASTSVFPPPSAPPLAAQAASAVASPAGPGLHLDPRVQRLQRLARLESLIPPANGGKNAERHQAAAEVLTETRATAVLALLALLVGVRGSPAATELFAAVGQHYVALLSNLGQLSVAAGVDHEGFVASFVACGLQLRGCAAFATPAAVDAALLLSLPADLDRCAREGTTLGVLHGLSNTYGRAPVALSVELVGRLHDLMDAFATSPHRRDLAYKKLLSALLEAIACSAVIDYGRTNNWITAIIQETYVVRGLFQKELLHSRVVAAALALLIRQYEEMSLNQSMTGAGAIPDFSEGDELIELVWRALQGGLSVWETAGPSPQNTTTNRDADIASVNSAPHHQQQQLTSANNKRELSLYITNMLVVVQALLRTEVTRLHCYFTITRAAAEAAAAVEASAISAPYSSSEKADKPASAAAARPYIPSAEEEALRVHVCANIIKFLIMPNSVMRATTSADARGSELASQLRVGLTEMATKVLSVVASKEFYNIPRSITGLAADDKGAAASTSSASTAVAATARPFQAQYSNHYYSQCQRLVEELIAMVLRREQGEESESMLAAACLRSLCVSDPNLRRFAVSEVTDTIIASGAKMKEGEQLAAVADETRGGGGGSKSRRKHRHTNSKADGGGGAAAGSSKNGKSGGGGSAQTAAQRKSAKYMSVYLETLCSIVVPLETRGGRQPLAAAELQRYGQLLCDTYEDSLRDAIALQGRVMLTASALDGGELVAPMRVAAHSFQALVQRLVRRLQTLVSGALSAEAEAEAAGQTQAALQALREEHLAMINDESEGVLTLANVAMRCVVGVAWPGSGILYQQGDGSTVPFSQGTTAEAMAPLALACVMPFLRPLTVLYRLLTLFPVLDLDALRVFARDADAGALTEPSAATSAKSVICQFQPTKLHAPLYERLGLSQFRACWLLLAHYGFTAEALSVSAQQSFRRGTELTRSLASHHRGARRLSDADVRTLRLLAAAAVPLLLMRSSEMQQATADMASLLRYVDPGADPAATSGAAHARLSDSLRTLCGGAGGWSRLTLGELSLMRALAELEMLRAAGGAIANLTLYQHFEVREFVATPATREVLLKMMSSVCAVYVSALHALVPARVNRLVRANVEQLVLLLCFSLASVRDAARQILELIVDNFPAYSVDGGGLPLLWSIMNLLSGGTRGAIESFCERVHFFSPPAVPGDAGSPDRLAHLAAVTELAARWVAKVKAAAPHTLFEVASKYVVRQERANGISSRSELAGSRMAVAAAQVDPSAASGSKGTATPSSTLVTPNYAHNLIRVSNAQGELRSAMRFVSAAQVEKHVIAHLADVLARCRRHAGAASSADAGGANWDRLRAAYDALFPDDADGGRPPLPQDHHHQSQKRAEEHHETTPAHRPALPAALLSEAEAAMSTAAALLLEGTASPSATQTLLQYIVQGPILCFDSALIDAGVQCWRWLLVSARARFLEPLLQHIVEGVEGTVRAGVGLMDGHYASQDEEVQTGDFTATARCNGRCAADYASNSPHARLFAVVADLYVSPASPFAMEPEVLRLLYELCARLLADDTRLSLKDASFAEYMRAMLLVGHVIRNVQAANGRQLRAGLPSIASYAAVGALRQRWYAALLRWFRKSPPSWYFAREPALSTPEMAVMELLVRLLADERSQVGKGALGFVDFHVDTRKGTQQREDQPVNVWAVASRLRGELVKAASDEAAVTRLIKQETTRLQGLLTLLRALASHELARMQVWLNPRRSLTFGIRMPGDGEWPALVASAVAHDPHVAVAMVARFSSSDALRRVVAGHVVAHPERFTAVRGAADLYLTEEVLKAGAGRLFAFRPCGIVSALRLLDSRFTKYPVVGAFAINSLMAQASEHLIFYLPQLLQVLASDTSGAIRGFLLRQSRRSIMFCHQLLWSLRTEGEGDSVLARRCRDLSGEVVAGMDERERHFYEAEFAFTDLVTSVSGELMKFDKPQRKPKLRERLRAPEFHSAPASEHVYLATDPEWRITDVIPHTAGAMQSAAKCPILVQFKCVPREMEDTRPPGAEGTTEEGGDSAEQAQQQHHGGQPAAPKEEAPAVAPVVKACIFKMGDDCRQDQISLQLMGLMKRILASIDMPFYLYPYRVVTTGQESGIIECVPNSLSRNEIGKLVESNIAEYYVQRFGHPETVGFARARENFIQSVASYSVVSYILNIKDRHNGNIMVNSEGHLVHIDFGFLFDTSPGGDINFESSPFKLTTEMVQLIGLDVGRSNLRSAALTAALVDPDAYIHFKVLVNRCFLAVRQYAREICILVELMLRSGLPCFKPKQTIADLAHRLGVDKDEVQAADYMRGRIHEARQHYRTVLYDFYQKVAEGIEM